MYDNESRHSKTVKGYLLMGAACAVITAIAYGISALFNLHWFVK